MPSHFEAHETYNGKWAQNYQTKLVISSVSSGQAVMTVNSPRHRARRLDMAFIMSGIRWLMLTTTGNDVNR